MNAVRVELRGRDRLPNFAAWYREHGNAGYRVWVAADQSHAVALRMTRRPLKAEPV